jgi:hypothetical protein
VLRPDAIALIRGPRGVVLLASAASSSQKFVG